MSRTKKFPRVPLPRQRGGAHGMAGREELDARQDIEARLNELEEDEEDDYLDLAEADFGGYDFFSDDYYDRDDYFDFIITRYDNERDF